MPLDPANTEIATFDATKSKFITVLVRRSYLTVPTTKTIWGLNGGPGESTDVFPVIMDTWFFPLDKDLTSYNMDLRGIKYSTRLNCSFLPPALNPYDSVSQQYNDDCNQEVLRSYGSKGRDILKYYTPYNQMMDLKNMIDFILSPEHPDCIDKAKGKPNVCTVALLAESVGTYNLNQYMQVAVKN